MSEAQEAIFEAFQQHDEGSQKGGTGLGLAISKKQLELMGSNLLIESQVHEGSHFYFTLHLPPAKKTIDSSDIEKKSILHINPEYKVKALVVDDVEENRVVLSKLLQDINVETIDAVNGREGVEKAKAFQPDIVFMDLRMPIMRGEEALKQIQKEFGNDHIKVVAITASALDRRREHYLDMGFHEYISKPFLEEEVFNSIKKLLNVEFVYENIADTHEKPRLTELDLSKHTLSDDLLESIRLSAEVYSITQLEKILTVLDKDNEVPLPLVQHFKELLNNYDMEGILKSLEVIAKE